MFLKAREKEFWARMTCHPDTCLSKCSSLKVGSLQVKMDLNSLNGSTVDSWVAEGGSRWGLPGQSPGQLRLRGC